MIKTIKHGINLLRHHFRDLAVSAKRSDKWPTVEKHFLQEHSKCAACGGIKKLNVHHIVPFSTDRTLELDINNLITLCMGEKECHLMLGHGDDFKFHNENVVNDAKYVLEHPNEFDRIITIAKNNRKKNN